MRSRWMVLFGVTLACIVAQEITAGRYTGKWEGNSGASGDFRIALTQDAAGKLTPDVSFTIADQEVKTKVTAFKLDGPKLSVVYSFDLQGNQAESAVEGERKGDIIEGKYRTRLLPDGGEIDTGTWSAKVANQ